MKENLLKILHIYCNDEIDNFKENIAFTELQSLVNELNYILVCDYGKAADNKKSENLYLGITVYDNDNEMIEIYDEGFLCASTMLVEIDKKHRFNFLSWQDKEFVEDLNWIINQLKLIKSKN